MGRLAYTWQLMGVSWDILKRDKKLLIFPLLSGICCLIVTATFIAGAVWGDRIHPAQTQNEKIVQWVMLFCFYFANYFVITFFNAGIVACAMSRMAGGEPTVGGGFREALNRVHLIAAWALLAATVGIALRMIEERSEKVGRFVAGLLGAAWSIMTFLVVPVLVMENKGPISAFQTSASLLKKTWGKQLAGNFSFGLMFFLLMIPGVLAVVGGMMLIAAHNLALGGLVLALAVIYFIALSLVHSALVSIFQAAVYMYTQGVVDEAQGFPVKLLQGAMAAK